GGPFTQPAAGRDVPVLRGRCSACGEGSDPGRRRRGEAGGRRPGRDAPAKPPAARPARRSRAGRPARRARARAAPAAATAGPDRDKLKGDVATKDAKPPAPAAVGGGFGGGAGLGGRMPGVGGPGGPPPAPVKGPKDEAAADKKLAEDRTDPGAADDKLAK